MVNDFEVIHMGGRTYNPILGRFMQADPFVQAPANLQNYNRYSYVLNNPISYTDPSGYIFKKINKALGKFAPVFGIALMFVPGMQTWAAQSLFHAAATGFLVGGVSTGSLRGAMVGALTGAAFHQIGSHFGSKFGDFSSATLGQQAQWVGGHALAGGISSSLSGGKFGHGFFSAGFTKFAMGNAGFDYSNQSSPAVAGRVAIAAIIGGTASVISGGKFKNGATTAAMAQLLNNETSARAEIEKTKKLARQYRDHIAELNPTTVMDQAALAGHAVELGYFGDYDSASLLIKSPAQAAMYKKFMLADLNAIYREDALNFAYSTAAGGVSIAGDPYGTAGTIFGSAGTAVESVYFRVGLLANAKSVQGFYSTSRSFNNYMTNSPSFSQSLVGIDVFSGYYYSRNCQRLRCF
jgi:RHS repeat-associated protein